MDLFELWATLGIDATGFMDGLTGALRWAMNQLWEFAQDVVDTGMGFDEQMSAVQAVLGMTEGTVDNMDRLRKYALLEARGSIFTAEEVASAYYYMGMAGWKTEEMLAGLNGVISLAAASGEDLAMVSDIVTDSITAFGLTANDVSHYVDILAQTATNSNTDVRRMGETFKYVAPVAGALGYSVDDVALSIGLLASAGIKGSQAGTTLRNIFTRIATNAGATSKDLGALDIITDKLGVSFYDAEGKARDWGDVLTELRAAWAGMGEEERTNVIKAFDETVESGEEANLVLKEFTEDVQRAQEISQKLAKQKDGDVWDRYASQIGEIGSQYDDLLKQLNIPIPKRPEEYAEALDQARIKLGMMSDQEQIYFAKQVGSLRGMPGFLRLLEAENEDVEQLVKSYENAEDAANRMAGVRLDNLAGDVKLLNAAFDVMKIAIFDNVKGPLRELAQYGTDAINRITDAINEDGLLGGIEQLGVEIKNLGENESIQSLFRSVGEAAAPILEGLFTNVLPNLAGTAFTLGSELASGLISGFGESLSGSDNPILKYIGNSLSGLIDITDYWKNTDMSQGAGSWTGVSTTSTFEGPTMTVGDVEVNAADVQAAIDAAQPSANGYMVTIGGIEMSIDNAQDLLTSLTPVTEAAGTQMATDLGTALGNVDTTALESKISSVGLVAGGKIQAAIQTALASGTYSIDVTANVTGLPEGMTGTEKHAKSMFGGHILRGATVFGLNANGQPLVGGEAGPEAVVGVGSLNQMIHQSVSDAFGSMSIAPANEGNALRDAVAGGLQVYGPTLAQQIGAAVGAVVASAVSRVASRPTSLNVNGKEFARAQADYNAIAANSRNTKYARGYGAGSGSRAAMAR